MQVFRRPSGRAPAFQFPRSFVVLTIVVALACVHARAATRNFIWKATRAQGVVYLVGSVHLLTREYYPLDPAFDEAFKTADLLVEELDMREMLAPDSQMQMLTLGMLPAGQTLDQVISPGTLSAALKKFADLGMPIEPSGMAEGRIRREPRFG